MPCIQPSKHVKQLENGKFKVNKAAIIKTLVKAQHQRRKLEKQAAGPDDDHGVIGLSSHEIRSEGETLRRRVAVADSLLNLEET